MIFAIDFDGTIVEDNRYPGVGEPKPYALEALKILKQRGHAIILWTCRENESLDTAKWHMSMLGIKFDAINNNVEYCKNIAQHKVLADYYLDDRSFPPFPGWMEFIDYMLKNEPRF